MTLPVKLLVTPAGHVLKQQGQTWSARLAGVAVLGTLTPLLQPFGSGLPELPGKPLPTGQEWVQDRAAPLPGSTETYPLRVTFTVGGRETIGPYDTVRIEFDCRTNLADRAFRFDGLPGVTLPLTVESLSHQFHGRSALDAERGRLVEQHLVSQFVSTSVGQTDRAFTLNSEVKIESTMLLLAVEAGPAAE